MEAVATSSKDHYDDDEGQWTDIEEDADERDKGQMQVQQSTKGPSIPPHRAFKTQVKAMKEILVESTHQLHPKFFLAKHALDIKYQKMQAVNLKKRREVILGNYEPTDEDCKHPYLTALSERKKAGKDKKKSYNPYSRYVYGIPNFWMVVLVESQIFKPFTYDELSIMKHLLDIEVEYTEDPIGYAIHFYFSRNKYFTNKVLTKRYEYQIQLNPNQPFYGPKVRSIGYTKIDWNDGYDLTLPPLTSPNAEETALKKPKWISKVIDGMSFIEYFNVQMYTPPGKDGNCSNFMTASDQSETIMDNYIGTVLKEKIVSRAVIYYDNDEDADLPKKKVAIPYRAFYFFYQKR